MQSRKPFFEEILAHYGSRTSELVNQVLNSDRFIQAVERILVASIEFRDLIQKSVQAAFEQINLPTRDDLETLKSGQRDLEDRLFAIEEMLEKIQKSVDKSVVVKKKKAVPKKTKKESAT